MGGACPKKDELASNIITLGDTWQRSTPECRIWDVYTERETNEIFTAESSWADLPWRGTWPAHGPWLGLRLMVEQIARHPTPSLGEYIEGKTPLPGGVPVNNPS